MRHQDDLCPGTKLPEDKPPMLKKNRYCANHDGQFEDKDGSLAGLSVIDTGGCSASQIIEAARLGKGHTRFGITKSALLDWIADR